MFSQTYKKNQFIRALSSLFIVSLFLHLIFIFENDTRVNAEDSGLSEEINALNERISAYKSALTSLNDAEASLESQTEDLEKAISELAVESQKTKEAVEINNQQITDTENKIKEIEAKQDSQKENLEKIIRLYYENREDETIELLFSNKISDFIDRLEAMNILQENLQEALTESKNLKKKQENSKSRLTEQQEELDRLYKLATDQENETRNLLAIKQILLQKTQSSEEFYEDKLASAEALKAGLISELGSLGTGPVTFETAVASAKKVNQMTGVRAALLLGILRKETNFGANTGTATYHTAYHGSDAVKNIELFKQITSELGLDPETTKVSAWPGYGSGGAMGYCQFMPATWLGYRGQVASIYGNSNASPWNLIDCLTAMGLKLAKNGAATQKYEDEWRAAGMYFAGGNWNNPKYAFYPNTVLYYASVYEKQL